MPGPKIDIERVQQAIRVVEDGQVQMEGVTKQILASAGLSLAAMKAPAGQVTAATFDDLGGGGKALAEELARLRQDLGTLIDTATQGAESALQVARSAAGGQAVTVAQGL